MSSLLKDVQKTLAALAIASGTIACNPIDRLNTTKKDEFTQELEKTVEKQYQKIENSQKTAKIDTLKDSATKIAEKHGFPDTNYLELHEHLEDQEELYLDISKIKDNYGEHPSINLSPILKQNEKTKEVLGENIEYETIILGEPKIPNFIRYTEGHNPIKAFTKEYTFKQPEIVHNKNNLREDAEATYQKIKNQKTEYIDKKLKEKTDDPKEFKEYLIQEQIKNNEHHELYHQSSNARIDQGISLEEAFAQLYTMSKTEIPKKVLHNTIKHANNNPKHDIAQEKVKDMKHYFRGQLIHEKRYNNALPDTINIRPKENIEETIYQLPSNTVKDIAGDIIKRTH